MESFLTAYEAAVGDSVADPADLRRRRDAFEVYERFLSSLHFRTLRNGEEDRRTGTYTHAVRQLTEGLKDRLA